MVALSVLVFVATAFNAHALDIPVKDGDQILLRGASAQVNYTVVPGATVLKISDLGPFAWSSERREQVIALDGPEPESRSAVAAALRETPVRATIEIQGPSLPIEIHLREGGVILTRGSHEARVNLQQGRVTASQRTGGLRVNGRKTDVTVADCSGRVNVDVYSGAVSLKNHQGDADVDLFAGQLTADQSKGTLALATSTASGKVQKFSGTLQLNLGKGAFSGTGLQGRIEGKTAEAPVTLQIQNETDVNLQSQTGRVQIQVPPSSGAQLNLVSTGDIFTPTDVRVNRGAVEKTARGKLKGDGRMQLTVRSVEGAIVVK